MKMHHLIRYCVFQDRFNDKLASLAGPTHDLPPLDVSEKKFSGKNGLYIGNLTNDVTEEEITGLFQKFGETSELFVNKEKNFAFIRMVCFGDKICKYYLN